MHDTKPTGDYITKLGRRLGPKFGRQKSMDGKMLDMHVQKNRLEVKPPDKDETDVKAVSAGLAGLMVDQDLAVLGNDLVWRVLPRGGELAEEHVSDKLEPFINGAFKVMQEEIETFAPMKQDLRIYGRAFAIGPIPAPQFWADETIQGLVDALNNADTEETTNTAKENLEEFKEENFAIVMRHMPAPSVLPVFNDRGLSELIYVHKMTVGDIKDRFGEKHLPEGKTKDDEEIEVFDYFNHVWVATVIPDGKEPLAHSWEHGVKTIPISWGEADKLPDNPYGLFWKGAVFHLRELLPSIDETLTDIRTNIREYTTAPPVAFLDHQARADLEGWPSEVEVKQDVTVNMLKGETAGRWPVPQVTVDAYRYLDIAQGYADLVGVRRDALSGQGPAGQSAVHQNQANQIAKAELKGAHSALIRIGERAARLLFRSVLALEKTFPALGKIPVRGAHTKSGSKEIAVNGSDVKRQEHLIEADLDLNLPINEAGNVQTASVAVQAGLADPLTAREIWMNIENPLDIDKKIIEHQFRMASAQIAMRAALAVVAGGVEQAQALGADELVGELAGLPEFAQRVLGNVARGANNQARAGRQQGLSELQSMETNLA